MGLTRVLGLDRGAVPDRSAGESPHEPRGVQPAAPLVDEHAVIGIAADLRALIDAGHQAHLVIEHPGEQRLLFAERVEMRGLERRTKVAGALVLARDGLLGNQRLEPDHRLGRDLEQLPRS